MTRSVEIPDAAVQEAAQVYWETEGNRAVCMRAALVAARPYLMPAREAIKDAISDELDGEGVVSYGLAPKLTARVMDLLNGES